MCAVLRLLVALFANSARIGTAGVGYTDPVARGTGVPEQKTSASEAALMLLASLLSSSLVDISPFSRVKMKLLLSCADAAWYSAGVM